MSVVIYHNPRCSKSRETLKLITDAGVEPTIVKYLTTGWTKPQLQSLFAEAGLTPQQALRAGPDDVGLTDPAADDDTVLDAMVAQPKLVNRPIVKTPKGVRLCRPPETVLEILDVPDV